MGDLIKNIKEQTKSMDAGKNAYLYYGFKREVSKEEFARRIREDTLLEVLNAVPVQKGDVLFIESGTIHAIGKDILIAEIQQNLNVTYRVYDYGRVGKDGKKRDLHIEKALAVTNRVPIIKDKSSYPHVADCDYFTVDKLNLDGNVMKRMEKILADAPAKESLSEPASFLIAETTREQRKKIVEESIGNISATCDGCMAGYAEMYQEYIDGVTEIREINRRFSARYIKGMERPSDSEF